MGKARTLGSTVSTGGPLANGNPGIADVTGLQTALDGKLSNAAGAVGTANVADDAVTLAKLQNIATASILGRNTAGTGDPEVLTGAQARAIVGADNASNLSTGTVATARLGSGTADSTTFLRGDQTWQVVSTTPSTSDVLNATAGASVGAVGTYAFAATSGDSSGQAAGRLLPGSSLVYAGGGNDTNTGNQSVFEGSGALTGTWMQMGYQKSYQSLLKATLWLRVS